jgi:hypothetical protein
LAILSRIRHDGQEIAAKCTTWEAAERSKIRIEACKWLIGKSKSKKDGEKIDLTNAASSAAIIIVGMIAWCWH